MSIQRFDFRYDGCGSYHMKAIDSGDYVQYEDYEKLLKKVEALEDEVESLTGTLDEHYRDMCWGEND